MSGGFIAALAACTPYLQPPGPLAATPMPPRLEPDRIVAADGAELPLRRWLPADGRPRAALVALHGFNDYSNAFEGLGQRLSAAGIAVYAWDQRGFGATAHRGIWAGDDRMIGDLRAGLALVGARHPGIPLHVLGESMGGAVVLAAWAEARLPVDGVVLVGPAVWGRVTMPFWQTGPLWVAAHLVPWLPLSASGLDITPSDNIEMLRALGRDPLVIKQSRVDAVWGVVGLMDRALDAVARFDAPSLVLWGRHDEIIPPAAARAMVARLPQPPNRHWRVALYDSGYHMLLRDLGGDRVIDDIAAWIAAPAAPLPSGAESVDPVADLKG
ncbi:MAG: lysophospholipase [Alphaproteobacteria bacterium]